jgi:hypothetical protein
VNGYQSGIAGVTWWSGKKEFEGTKELISTCCKISIALKFIQAATASVGRIWFKPERNASHKAAVCSGIS